MWRMKCWLLFVVSIFFSTAALTAQTDPVLSAPETGNPGNVVTVVVYGGGIEESAVSLQDPRGRAVSKNGGFNWTAEDGRSCTVFMVGIPPTADAGRYSLVVTGKRGRGDWRLESPLTVTEGDFPESVINLTGRMDTLFTDSSERKRVEAQRLWAVLTHFDPESVFFVGAMVNPLEDGAPTSGFGVRRRYVSPDGSESTSVHHGSDFRAERGTPVTAAARGRIVLAEERFLTGNTVVIEHLPGVQTLYYHMESLDVTPGRIVEAGARIGSVGETGFATGVHLHWEMRVGATPVHPVPYLTMPLLDADSILSNM